MEHVTAGRWTLRGMRVVFLATLATIMAFYAGTQPASIFWLKWLLLVVSGGYVLARVMAGSAQSIELKSPILWLVILLLATGWLAALFPESVYSRDFRIFFPLQSPGWWPWGSVDGDISENTMVRLTGLLGVLFIAADMGRSSVWRKVLLVTVVTLGVGVAVFGLLQRGLGDVGGYWGVQHLRFAFGPFWYHANAGAFLNLCWPLAVAGLMTAAMRLEASRASTQLLLSAWLLALLAMAAGAFVNVSKAAQLLFVLQLAAMGWICMRQWRATRGSSLTGAHWMVIAVFALLLAALLYMLGFERGLDRWHHLVESNFDDARWEMALVILPWLAEAGAFGFGPGTFSAVYMVKSTDVPTAPRGFWRFAHDDYLQTLLEWGWLGTLLWLMLAALILWRLAVRMNQARNSDDTSAYIWRAAILTSLGATAIHAALDFPLQIFGIQLITACLAGLALADWRGTGRSADPGARLRRRHGTQNRN